MKYEVCIVVPCYKAEFDENERISFDRLINILGHYDIYIIAPRRLKEKIGYLSGVETVCFDDSDFDGRDAYSRLMLSEKLYRRFADYKYMLLHQLDVYVFSDRLKEFCDLGFDYIGAPLPKYLWKNIYEALGPTEEYCVGNGGFSLRKISSCLRILTEKEKIYHRTGMGKIFEVGEDEFWGYCGNSEDIDFSVPPIDLASRFSMEAYDKKRFSEFPDDLPFGCHGWPREPWNKVWKPYVFSKGDVDEAVIRFCDNYTFKRKLDFVIDSMIKKDELLLLGASIREMLTGKTVSIWGYGKYGHILSTLIQSEQISLKRIIDVKVKAEDVGVKSVVTPDEFFADPSDDYVIISSLEYEEEIEMKLEEKGYRINEDYVKCSELFGKMITRLFQKDLDQVYLTA